MASWSSMLTDSQLRTEVEFRGVNRVRNQLRALASAVPDDIDPVMGKHAKMQSAYLRGKAYPARLPNQKYIRTYRMKRGFRAQKRGKAKWAVINRVKNQRGRAYPAFVIKRGMQNKKYHAWRWWTIEGEMEKSMPALTRKLTEKLESIMEGVQGQNG